MNLQSLRAKNKQQFGENIEQDIYNYYESQLLLFPETIKNHELYYKLLIDYIIQSQCDVNNIKNASNNKELFSKNLNQDESDYSTTDLFQCSRCKNRKTSYYTAQIRSGDESATIFITCRVCNLNWRQ